MTDEEMLAALREALAEREESERRACLRTERARRALDAWMIGLEPTVEVIDEPEPEPTLPPEPPKRKPRAQRVGSSAVTGGKAAPRPPKPCCGSLGPRHKATCPASEKVETPTVDRPALAAVPDHAPAAAPPLPPSATPKEAGRSEREPVRPADDDEDYHFECSECPAEFAKHRDLVMHCISRHERQPKPIERRPIASEAS